MRKKILRLVMVCALLLSASAEYTVTQKSPQEYMGGLIILAMVVGGAVILMSTKNISKKQITLEEMLDGREQIFIDRTKLTPDGEKLTADMTALLARIRECARAGEFESLRGDFTPEAFNALIECAAGATSSATLDHVERAWVESGDAVSACVFVNAVLRDEKGTRSMLYRFVLGPETDGRRLVGDYIARKCPGNMKVETIE